MSSWREFEEDAAGLAAAVRARFEANRDHVLATLRKDGSPRVSGVEVRFTGGELTTGSMRDAVKARDLQRDGRYALHSRPGDGTAVSDAKISGRAREITAENAPSGVEAPAGSHLFHLDIGEVVLTSVSDDETHLVIESWHPGTGLRVARR